jgi:6-pyruvoyltetrahydropterin/6-carboxytetrahydropterin synthase
MDYSVRIEDTFDSGHVVEGHPTCGRPHGHRYRVEVTSTLRFEPVRRQVTDTTPLVEAIRGMCFELEGRSLNDMIPGIVPTADGVAAWFMERLLLHFPRVTSVTVWERPHCAFTVNRVLES